MRLIKALAVLAFVALPAALHAQSRPVVVELYTSQGCSSCPPADRYLAELAQRSDVIALSLHVHYWDYMGWKDTFAAPYHAVRQRQYAKVNGHRTVYTPQMVIQGTEMLVGSRRRTVEPFLRAHSNQKNRGGLRVAREGGKITVEVGNAERPVPASMIQIIRYAPKHEVKIARGENRGREIVYTNVVERWDVVGRWDGREAKRFVVNVPDGGRYVVIVQEENTGPIFAAARVE